MRSSKEIIEQTEKYGAHTCHPKEVVYAHAEGVIVSNPEGKEFYDMLGGYSVLVFGHRHPELVQTAKDQLDKLTFSSRAFYSNVLGEWMEKICKFTGKDMVLPMNSGAEAVEAAIKAARRWGNFKKGVEDGKQEVIVCSNNFHGRTITATSASVDPVARKGYGPLTPGFKVIEYGNLEELKAAITPNTVAFMMEPIQGEAGIIIPPAGFMKNAYKICKENNVLLIDDEVQTGFARTGRMFACEYEGVIPDVYVLGKALGGGIIPVSAITANEEILGVFTPGSHGSTFGGNPLGAAVSMKAMEILKRDNYPKQAEEKGNYLISKLKEIKNDDILEIRGMGLLIGIEFKVNAVPYVEKLIDNGILAKETHGKTIRMAPPVIITYEQIDDAVKKIERSLRK